MKRYLPLLPVVMTLLTLIFSACGGSTAKLSDPVRAKVSDDGQSQKIDILVDHAYKPNNIVLQAGMPAKINFYRKEHPESCATEVVIPDLNITASLPNNEVYSVDVPPLKAGQTISFHCGMKMMSGQIMVLGEEG